MKSKTFNSLVMLIFLIVCIGIIVSILSKNFFFAFIPMIVGMAALYFLERMVIGILEDERSSFIREKADSLALNIFSIISVIFIILLIVCAEVFRNPELKKIAVYLSLPLFLLLLLSLIIQWFYSRKYGE